MKWISVEDELPEAGEPVLIYPCAKINYDDYQPIGFVGYAGEGFVVETSFEEFADEGVLSS